MSKNKYREAHPEWFDEKGRPHVWVLRELLDYNPETGELRWKKRDARWFLGDERTCRLWNGKYAEKSAGCTAKNKNGKIQIVICLLGHSTTGLSVAYAIANGFYSMGSLSAKNDDATDIRHINITTVIDVSAERNRETGFFRTDGSSKYNGVSFHKRTGKWQAALSVDGRMVFIGLFFSETGAAAAYDDYLQHNGLQFYRNEVCPDEANLDEKKARNHYFASKRALIQSKLKTGKRRSKYVGVYLDNRTGGYGARISVNKKRVFIGKYTTEIEAADAYDAAARKYFGPDAFQNRAPRPDPVALEPMPVKPAAPINANPTDGDDF